MSEYAGDLIKAVHEGLAASNVAQSDLQKLATAKRLLPNTHSIAD